MCPGRPGSWHLHGSWVLGLEENTTDICPPPLSTIRLGSLPCVVSMLQLAFPVWMYSCQKVAPAQTSHCQVLSPHDGLLASLGGSWLWLGCVSICEPIILAWETGCVVYLGSQWTHSNPQPTVVQTPPEKHKEWGWGCGWSLGGKFKVINRGKD